MKKFLIVLGLMLPVLPAPIRAQVCKDIFPTSMWQKANPQTLGWSLDKLEQAKKTYESFPPASVMVIDHGQVIAEWGDSAKRIKISSMRKSILSAL